MYQNIGVDVLVVDVLGVAVFAGERKICEGTKIFKRERKYLQVNDKICKGTKNFARERKIFARERKIFARERKYLRGNEKLFFFFCMSL